MSGPTPGEVIAAISAIVAALALLLNFSRERKSNVMDSQTVRDKLDYISDTARDTREDVRALDRKLDDHTSRIAKVEAHVEAQDKRIQRLEAGK